jgi:hypothetical protein
VNPCAKDVFFYINVILKLIYTSIENFFSIIFKKVA